MVLQRDQSARCSVGNIEQVGTMLDFVIYRLAPAALLAIIVLLLLPQTSPTLTRMLGEWIYGF